MLHVCYRPLIAAELQCSDEPGWFMVDGRYAHLLSACGAAPAFLVPSLRMEALAAVLDHADGVMILGGDDINPALYGEEPLPTTDASLATRDSFEPLLLDAAAERDMPFLGICRGVQMLNVWKGGTLIQRLPTEPIDHWQKTPASQASHFVELMAGSPIEDLAPSGRLEVNSLHHQAVGMVAPGFSVAAKAPDGTIESVWDPDRLFMLGVQWHPEWRPDDEGTRRLMRHFLDACEVYHGRKSCS